MHLHKEEFKVRSMASLLEVSPSNFYSYIKREKDPKKKIDPMLLHFVEDVWLKNKKLYGALKIHAEAKKENQPWGIRKVKTAMKLLEIHGKQETKFRIQTTDSNHYERIAPDLIKRNFRPKAKNKIWVSDVTFIGSNEGWLYLCVIIDLYSRKVVGWTLSSKNDANLIENTLEKAIQSRNPERGLIFHSDRGSNYCSAIVRDKLNLNKIRRSNSRKGNCWDNSPSESFFATLKRELEYNFFLNANEAKNTIYEFIELFYNRQRSHSYLGYVSPEEFEIKAA
jgi:transposase InsO family protein